MKYLRNAGKHNGNFVNATQLIIETRWLRRRPKTQRLTRSVLEGRRSKHRMASHLKTTTKCLSCNVVGVQFVGLQILASLERSSCVLTTTIKLAGSVDFSAIDATEDWVFWETI